MSNVVVKVPNIGGSEGSRVIEILVKEGQMISEDTALITLESDKASMEIPSPYQGVVKSIVVSLGDKVSEGSAILEIEAEAVEEVPVVENKPNTRASVEREQSNEVYAGPFVRRMAFELGIDLSSVPSSGSGGRVTIEDMKLFLTKEKKSKLPAVDFSKYGDISTEEMTRIQGLSAKHLLSVWQNVPQVTQHHQVDITELEVLRKQHTEPKVTIIAYVMKALVKLMQENSVYRRAWIGEEAFCIRNYYHIGFACETPNGLVVPVCKDVDQKDIIEIAKDIMHLSEKARNGQLDRSELEGSVATISSLGGIGGGYFTPIVNAPDAFILGISRACYQPVYEVDSLVKRYIMPISFTYDHRLIDGADGARFVVGLARLLENMPEELV